MTSDRPAATDARDRIAERRERMQRRRAEFRRRMASASPEQRRRRRSAIVATARQAATDTLRGLVRSPRSRSASGITTDADERRAQLSRMGVGVWVRVRWARLRSRGKPEDERREIFQRVMVRSAQDAVELVGNMKGVLMKFAQMASYDPGMPEHVQKQLASLQSAAPAMTPELSAECVERELGAPPHKLFKRWDAEPVASASIGQVHRAVTRDGREVAVKVQYPGVDDAIRADLQNAGMLANMVKAMGDGGMDVDALLGEVAARVTEELDYRLEANNQQWFADRYRGHTLVKVPDVVGELSSARVLTSEYVHGLRFAEFTERASQAERTRAGEIVHRFAFSSIFRDGVFTSDPHPGNYLFCQDGRVCFLDFGLVKKLDGDVERAVVRAPVEAILRDDRDALVEALRAAGALTPDAQPDRADVWTLFETRFGPLATDEVRTYARGRRALSDEERQAFREAAERIGEQLTFPAVHAFFLRYVGGIAALLTQLGAESNWHRVTREVLFDEPPYGAVGHEWQAAAGR